MARNNKAISVKIATTKVIKALETKLAQIQKDKANQKANEAKFEKAQKAYNKGIAKLALAQISKAEDLDASTRYNGKIYVSFSCQQELLSYLNNRRKILSLSTIGNTKKW